MNISIIIPVYKVPQEYLRSCFESLVAQTMQDCEFVVISDGAPKTECSICEEYAAKDSRFKFFKCEHAGVSSARNFGLKKALGEYITFVDSDDQVTENFCEAIYNNIKKWNSDILLFEQAFNKKNNISYYHLFKQDIPIISSTQYKDLLARLFVPTTNDGLILAGICSKAYRQKFIIEHNLMFQPELHYSEDQLFCLNAFLGTKNISYLANHPLYIQNHRPNSASFAYKASYEKEVYIYLEFINNIVKKHFNLINKEQFYNRVIQCILYTLDKSIFRPDRKTSTNKRKSTFLSFINNIYCKEAILKYNKRNFNLTERIACYLCKKNAFWTLYLVSKKWHLQRIIKNFRDN